MPGADLRAEVFDGKKIRVAIFPFNDMQSESLNMGISSIIKAGLSGHDFIETIPLEVVEQKIYEIEPFYLWTKREGPVDSAGIVWAIEPKIVGEVEEVVSAEYSIYGDLIRFGSEWTVVAHILKEKDLNIRKSFTVSSLKEEEIPESLKEVSKKIAAWLKRENIINEAEEGMRRYRGGLYTHSVTLGKIKSLADTVQESVPLHALLLELYLEKKEKYREKIIDEGLAIINLYDPANDDDTRYLLSLNIDPYDAAADVYEGKRDWKSAIYLRHKARKLFPYMTDRHIRGLGRDYYFYANSFEKKGDSARALENYKKAITYLDPASEHYKRARERIDSLNKKKK
jgi:hypothetical protein